MGHHVGNESTSQAWTEHCNDLIYRLTELYPENFVGVAQLPQSPGVPIKSSVEELERTVEQLGFVGCNLNPDPSGGYFTGPPLGDRYWYPLYERMCELEVPAMIHVSGACNTPYWQTTGSYYLSADTVAFMQLMESGVFRDFPTLKLIIPHGGGAVPYHWGRFRGLADMLKLPPLSEAVLENIYFDTCVYHQAGIDLLLDVIPTKNILFASEMIGAVRGIDPETGFYFDDTKRYIDESRMIDNAARQQIFEGNARAVFKRLAL
jgi:4-oxalmesaconate hydratase